MVWLSRLLAPRRNASVRFLPRSAAATIAAGALALAGCGGAPAPPPPAAGDSEVDWAATVMRTLYLYADRLPPADLSKASTAAQTLEALRVNPPDRFSYVERRTTYEAFFDEGVAVGLGIGYRIDGDAIVLRFVQPASPAAAAGLARGDRIDAIDGVAVAALTTPERVSEALGPPRAGLAVTLGVLRTGAARRETTVTKAPYSVAPVLAHTVIEQPSGPVGYVALYTFSEPARQAWADALEAVRAAGARRLVVDLRDNGGGRLFVAAEVAASLAPARTAGQPFVHLRYNARMSASDLRIDLPAQPTTGAFDRVAWLVSDATCSAAESLIAGLRPLRADAIVGTRTCGKPVGFSPQTRGDTVLSAVSFETVASDGSSGWFEGLAPTCAVDAEPWLPWGDPRDPRLATALNWLEWGTCAAAAASGPVPKRSPEITAARGLASQTGLH